MNTFIKAAIIALSSSLLLGCATMGAVPLGGGDWVLARWQPEDMYYYPGVVTERHGDDLDIQYDDGDTGTQAAMHVRRFDWHAGTHLECQFSDGNWYPATITEMGATRVDMRIRYDDGDRQSTDTSKCRVHD